MSCAAEDLPSFLSSSALFSAMTPEELTQVSQFCTILTLKRDGSVFRAGDACTSFHIVVSGQVKLFVGSPHGHEKVIEIFGAGQSFAEAFMFLDTPYIFNAQALTDVVLVKVSREGIYTEIARDPKLAIHMLAGVSRRLETLIQDVAAYTLKSGKQRLIAMLLHRLEPAAGPDLNAGIVMLPANKSTIASRLSLTPEYFSRVLHELVERGLIRIDRRRIIITDVRALEISAVA